MPRCGKSPGLRAAVAASSTGPGRRTGTEPSEESEGFTTRAGVEGLLPALAGKIDHVHRAVALTRDEQFVAAVDHVHWLAADLDCGLLAERRIDQTDGVTVEARDGEYAPVGAVAGNLGGLRHVLEADCFPDPLHLGVDQKQHRLLIG